MSNFEVGIIVAGCFLLFNVTGFFFCLTMCDSIRPGMAKLVWINMLLPVGVWKHRLPNKRRIASQDSPVTPKA